MKTRKELYAILKELVERPSENLFVENLLDTEPSPVEKEVALFIKDYLEANGISVKKSWEQEKI